MKLIIAGATGFVGTEVIKQALCKPAITSVVALGRRDTAIPQDVGPNADIKKFKSIVCEDFENYSDSVKEGLSDADACIWLLAVTPAKSKRLQWEDVRKICHGYAVVGVNTIPRLPRKSDKPFRFMYTSGYNAERDQTKKPMIFPGHFLMRGETESRILEVAKESQGTLEACIAKPGLIMNPGFFQRSISSVVSMVSGMAVHDVKEIAAALLDQVVNPNGIEKDTLMPGDLVRIGRKAFEARE